MHVLIGVMMAFLLVGSGSSHAKSGWEYVGTTKGVKVERKTVPNSALFAFRGEGTFEAPIGLLVSVLKDEHIAEEWVDLMLEHTVVRKLAPDTNLLYESYGLPWPISNRDYVMKEEMKYDADTKVFTINYESITDPSRPENPDFVRAMAYRTFWRLKKVGPGRTFVEVEVLTDPKGALPAWLINLIQKDWPWKTIDGLVTRSKKGDITPDERVASW
jgi:hypothetical protein